jgi:GAF domain-containing protein
MSPALNPDDQSLQNGLRELAGMLLGETGVERMLESVTRLAASSLPGCEAASVTLVRDGRPTTPACTPEFAVDVDRWQYDTREGPCLAAIGTGAIVRVDSFAEDGRWPRLAERAAQEGVKSALSVPLLVGEQVLGALNLYSTEAGAFAGKEDHAVLFGRQASITLANAHALHRAEQLARQLAQALENRDVIGQAKGIIMAAQDLSSDEAFDVLRRASQRANRKLHEVARDIVERRNGGPPLGDVTRQPSSPGRRSSPAS